jgi:hypothetical protein
VRVPRKIKKWHLKHGWGLARFGSDRRAYWVRETRIPGLRHHWYD